MKVDLEKLKFLRQEREMSQANVSRYLGFESPQGYAAKELGQRDITAEELGKLAQLLSVPVGDLYTDDAEKFACPSSQRPLSNRVCFGVTEGKEHPHGKKDNGE